MGDTAVDFFLETLKNLITSSNFDFIIDDQKHQLQSLEEEIKYLRGFLNATKKKRNEHSEVMKLVKRIRDVVSEAKNIVELFVVHASKPDDASYSLRERQDHLSLNLDSVNQEIGTLKAEMKQIYDENMYDINGVADKRLKYSSTGSEGSSGGSNTSKEEKEKVVVGFEKERKILMEQLHSNGEGGRLEIISIIGAPGGGKTTLAKEVYQDPLTLYAFQILAWVVVSQAYDKNMKRDMLISILKSASQENHGEYEKSSTDMLGEKVHKCLKGSKYLIVLDDIWSIEAWNDIQRSFPNECKGSKVLFTSRQLVVQSDDDGCVHRLAPIHESCSWELLQKKVFGMKCCPPQLVDIGKQIAKKCEGLPLAIVAIAGILATKDKTLDVWEEVAKHLSSIIAKDQEGCMEILELSYDHLPLHLKACFVYIGGFPEDYKISVRELIWLWIAGGFIQKSERGKSLEAVAKDYLTDLINRSLVMVATKRSFGGIKACRIHDLLRELCLKKAEEDNFLVHVCEDDSFPPSSATYNLRRLFISGQFLHRFLSRARARNLRSILCTRLTNSSQSVIEQSFSFFVENFKLLRVLSVIPIVCQGEIGTGYLDHLRYLAYHLPTTYLYSAVKFSNLLNLETLNLHGQWENNFIQLSADIFKMVKLRHLYSTHGVFIYHISSEEATRFGFDHSSKLDSLQTLNRICPCVECQSFLVRTPNLRKLGVHGKLISQDGVLMLPDLEFLKCLETLRFTNTKFFSKSGATLPTGLKLPSNVTRLTLKHTYLQWKELSILLAGLPSLEVLKLLVDSCCGPVWDTSELEEGFPQLKYLRFESLDIEEWNASEDQFPRLEVLVLRYCQKLERIPIDFANLNELREITMNQCSPSLEESSREIQEELRNKKGDDDCLNLLLNNNTGQTTLSFTIDIPGIPNIDSICITLASGKRVLL